MLPARAIGAWLDSIDPVAAVRGISTGFSVLLIASLMAPILANRVPVVGGLALVLAAVVGFAAAASRQGNSPAPALQGDTAAVGSYLLVLPLVVMVSRRWDVEQIGVTLLTAVVVGGLVGPLAAGRAHAAGRR
jgi:hypothetical protein